MASARVFATHINAIPIVAGSTEGILRLLRDKISKYLVYALQCDT